MTCRRRITGETAQKLWPVKMTFSHLLKSVWWRNRNTENWWKSLRSRWLIILNNSSQKKHFCNFPAKTQKWKNEWKVVSAQPGVLRRFHFSHFSFSGLWEVFLAPSTLTHDDEKNVPQSVKIMGEKIIMKWKVFSLVRKERKEKKEKKIADIFTRVFVVSFKRFNGMDFVNRCQARFVTECARFNFPENAIHLNCMRAK